MVKLIHEIWISNDQQDGQELEMCCLAGPDGDAARADTGPFARLIHRFEAESHFEAMTYYYRFLELGPYTTDVPIDFEPYPTEWAKRQNGEV